MQLNSISSGSGLRTRDPNTTLCPVFSFLLLWLLFPLPIIWNFLLIWLPTDYGVEISHSFGLSYHHLLTLPACRMYADPTGKDPTCTCPLPPPARLVKRLNWSSCPSSVPRQTDSHCTLPKAVPPSTIGMLLCHIVKVGCVAWGSNVLEPSARQSS